MRCSLFLFTVFHLLIFYFTHPQKMNGTPRAAIQKALSDPNAYLEVSQSVKYLFVKFEEIWFSANLNRLIILLDIYKTENRSYIITIKQRWLRFSIFRLFFRSSLLVLNCAFFKFYLYCKI